jgi:hypothetical protein
VKLTVKLKCAGPAGLIEKCEEFTTEEPAEYTDRKEEAGPAGDPA